MDAAMTVVTVVREPLGEHVADRYEYAPRHTTTATAGSEPITDQGFSARTSRDPTRTGRSGAAGRSASCRHSHCPLLAGDRRQRCSRGFDILFVEEACHVCEDVGVDVHGIIADRVDQGHGHTIARCGSRGRSMATPVARCPRSVLAEARPSRALRGLGTSAATARVRHPGPPSGGPTGPRTVRRRRYRRAPD